MLLVHLDTKLSVLLDQLVRERGLDFLKVFQATPQEALHRKHGMGGISDFAQFSRITDDRLAVLKRHDGRH